MTLLIISHTPHYRMGDSVAGWAPTIREIDALAAAFSRIVHIAPLYEDAAPPSALPYASSNVMHVPVRPAGGDGLRNKLSILCAYPSYAFHMLREMGRCDAVHVRFPANISLLALLLLHLRRSPRIRWFKYAGNWFGGRGEPFGYRLQRLLLTADLHGGIVTVNGTNEEPHDHIRVFRNPSFSIDEYRRAAASAELKSDSLPLSLLFCGRVEREKGALIVCAVALELEKRGMAFDLAIIGEGRDLEGCRAFVRSHRLEGKVHFNGWLPPHAIAEYYIRSQFLLLPSSASEGWPKVLSEAMAHGVIPIASDISSIPRILMEYQCGTVMHTYEPAEYVDAIHAYVQDPARWKRERDNAVDGASDFTYERHVRKVITLMGL